MRRFFNFMGTFARALPQFLLFELLFKLLLLGVGAPALTWAVRLTSKASGVGYISDESLLVYLSHPLTILAVVVMLFFIAVFSIVELTALTACFACFSRHERITIGGMFLVGFKSLKKAFKGAGKLNFLVFMLFMPIAQFTVTSGVFLAPVLPVLRRIFRDISGTAAIVSYVLIQVLFVLLIAGRSYSLHYLVLTDRRFPECVRSSKHRLGGKKLKMGLTLLVYSLVVLAAIAAVTLGISFLIVLIIKGFSRPDKAFRSALKVLRYTGEVIYAVSSFFAAPALICWVTERFFADIGSDDGDIVLPRRSSGKMGRVSKVALVVCLTAGAALNIVYFRELYRGNISLNTGIVGRAQISAHRGFSSAAPENTMYAFDAAIDSGADYIELDVQMTKDGQLVVFHDEKLDRTTDGTGRLSDYTYPELQRLSAGKWFGRGGEFADAKIMLLSDVLEEYGGDILFNIEIKDHGDTTAAAKETVALIEEYGIVSSCYVTSFSYAVMRQVKQLNPGIKTALIANFSTATAYSHLKYIDAVSMNYTFVNQNVVNTVHMNGKKIFVWTVDRTDDMQKMIALGVDNIITNRPDIAAEIIYSGGVGENILTILRAIFGNY